MTKEKVWCFTPYNKKVDKAMMKLADLTLELSEFIVYEPYQEDLQIVFDYIRQLERTIYGYTE